MAKISELSDGGSLQSTDFLIAVRSGGNVKVQADGNLSLGTVTADGLTVQGTATTRPTIGNSDVNTSGLTTGLNFEPISNISNGAKLNVISGLQPTVASAYTAGFEFVTEDHSGGGSFAQTKALTIGASGDISFYEDTGTTAKFFWDASAESLGIGTASPASLLHLSAASPALTIEGSTASSVILQDTGASTNQQVAQILNDGGNLTFRSLNDAKTGVVATAMTINNLTGNVGIGTSPAASTRLHALGDTSNYSILAEQPSGYAGFSLKSTTVNQTWSFLANDNASNSDLQLYGGSSAGVKLTVDSSGNLLVGTTDTTAFDGTSGINIGGSRNALAFSTTGNNQMLIYSKTTGLQFYDATNNADRMLLDNSGNLLVGTTDTTPWDNSTATAADDGIFLGGGRLGLAKWGGVPLLVNRTDSDGEIAIFYKDGSAVGSIGTDTSDLNINGGSGHSGIRFQASSLIPRLNGSDADNSIDLGYDDGIDTYRFKDLYLSGDITSSRFSTDGDGIKLASGMGIKFDAYASGNVLDDYEEGTWTLSFADASTGGNVSSTTGNGIYTKVGNQVTIVGAAGNIDTTGLTSGNLLYIRGLPFPSKDISGLTAYFAGSGFFSSISYSETPQPYVPDNGASYALLSDGANILVSALTSGAADVYITITYQTT